MSDVRLVVEGLCIEGAGRRLVGDVSFEARDGSITGMVGASGSGKSMSVRAAMGVVDVAPGVVAGTVRYPGTGLGDVMDGVRGAGPAGSRVLDARMRPLRGAWVTLAPQAAASALNPGRTVGAQLARSLARGATPVSPESMVASLREVGLDPRVLAQLPSELSGGMAQRAALAVALAPGPRVLIADEPEGGLDPGLRWAMLELLRDRATERGLATVLITHDRAALAAFAQAVVTVGGP